MRTLGISLCLSLLLVLSACTPSVQDMPSPAFEADLSLTTPYEAYDGRDAYQRTTIDRVVWENIMAHGPFRWENADDYLLWSAVINSDSIVSLGYQPQGYANLEETIHLIDVNSKPWKATRDALIDFILEEENRDRTGAALTRDELLAFGEKELPYLNVKISSFNTLAQLRRMQVVRYLDPMGYGIEPDVDNTRSSSGCGGSAASNLTSADYTTVTPGAKASWHYDEHNIRSAWNTSTGDNITVGVIDTGVSPNQDKLNSKFSSGQSTGRFRDKLGTFVTGFWWWASIDGPNDDCGHGTNMAGMVSAPRTNSGATVGVAYKSNLVSIRGTDDVVINESREKDGVSDAYVILGNRSDVKVISMSLGDVFYSGQVADAVKYAYNKGKLIFSAAGTSLTWTSWYGVIFPATMSQTVAVTGVQTGLPLKKCDTCHDGSAVDFVVVMQDRNNTNRTAITLHTSGNTPARSGGSSIATATMAGMAALVWGKNTSQSRSQVLQELKNASSIYPARDGNFGWGTVNAAAAVAAVQ